MRTPFAVELSVDMQVLLAGCLWLSSDSTLIMGTACWPPMNMPPISASAAEETMFCRVLKLTRMAPLSGGHQAMALLR